MRTEYIGNVGNWPPIENRMTAWCSTQIEEPVTKGAGDPPKIAGRQGDPPISNGMAHSVMSIQCVEQWVDHRHVGRFFTRNVGCSTQKPTSIGWGVGVGQQPKRGKYNKRLFIRFQRDRGIQISGHKKNYNEENRR